MKDNDLSNLPTHRYWVISDVCIHVTTRETTTTSRWFRHQRTSSEELVIPDLLVMNRLWRWSLGPSGARLELVFHGMPDERVEELWGMLDRSTSNPFNDWFHVASLNEAVAGLPYRSDVLGVIDLPERVAIWGGRGMTMEQVL